MQKIKFSNRNVLNANLSSYTEIHVSHRTDLANYDEKVYS